MNKEHDTIAVLDFGGQYAHLIANRVRRMGVFSEIFAPTVDPKDLAHCKGIIFSGGPSSVYAEDAPAFNDAIIEAGLPILGICYGHQLLSDRMGGKVQPGEVKEYGIAQLVPHEKHPLLAELPEASPMWMSHGDKVAANAPGFRNIASTSDCDTAAVANDEKKIYGIQFHPEVTHSQYGEKLMENFLDICDCTKDWNMSNYLEDISARIQAQVGDEKVFLLVSGGVDSTVAFVLLNKVLGKERVFGLHIDTGTMRLNESEDVVKFLHAEGMDNLKVVDASENFLQALGKNTEPETKRSIIGETFLTVKDTEIENLGMDPKEWMLAQGTIYPDTIESGGTDNADVIKTHHNRVEGIMDLLKAGRIIEPLADLYKDEVRALGEELGIPHALVWRHPFPGPGLGVRLLCSDGQAQGKSLEEVPGLQDLLKERKLEASLLPIQSVGVQGDARSYAQPLVLKGEVCWKDCEKHSTDITNRFNEINRLVLEINTVDANADYTLVEQYCQRKPLDTLRQLDDICTKFLQAHDLYERIWQMPVVLLPVELAGKPVIVLRPVDSTEAMTASFSEIDQKLLQELWLKLAEAGAGAMLYDITHKPPGTIEWE